MPDAPGAAVSYRHCRRVARAAARNFYYGFLLLPRPKGDALCALYAFMRRVDDIADFPGPLEAKQQGLAACRAALDRALAGQDGPEAFWLALRDTVERYAIPPRYLHDVVSGAEMDLTLTRYATFDRLREYCYRVAGAVGLSCLYVFGFTDPRAPELAEKLGIAFQLTNILRDVRRDWELGRVYLPEEDLARFGCRAEDLVRAPLAPAAVELVRFEGERAWEFYAEGCGLIPLVHEDSRAALWALARIYSGILAKIEARGYDVAAAPPARLSAARKAAILLRARLGLWSNDVLEERDRHRRRAGGALLGRRAG
jgi:phytoene synthase